MLPTSEYFQSDSSCTKRHNPDQGQVQKARHDQVAMSQSNRKELGSLREREFCQPVSEKQKFMV